MNFESQNTNGPPDFSVPCDNMPTKDCRTVLRFSLGLLIQNIRKKNRGGLRGPYAAPLLQELKKLRYFLKVCHLAPPKRPPLTPALSDFHLAHFGAKWR